MKKPQLRKTKIRFNLTARNEIVKALSSWFRTISLGLMAVALIEPLRSPDSYNSAVTSIAAFGALFTMGGSLLIYALLEEPKL